MSVSRGIRRHGRENAERAALATKHGAPERVGLVREDVLGERGLDDPRALVELVVELARPPAGVADVDPRAPEYRRASPGRPPPGGTRPSRPRAHRRQAAPRSRRARRSRTAGQALRRARHPCRRRAPPAPGTASSTGVSDVRLRTTPERALLGVLADEDDGAPEVRVDERRARRSGGVPRSELTVVSSPHGRCLTRDPSRRAAAGLPRRGPLRGRRDADPRSRRRAGAHPERLLLGRSVHAARA